MHHWLAFIYILSFIKSTCRCTENLHIEYKQKFTNILLSVDWMLHKKTWMDKTELSKLPIYYYLLIHMCMCPTFQQSALGSPQTCLCCTLDPKNTNKTKHNTSGGRFTKPFFSDKWQKSVTNLLITNQKQRFQKLITKTVICHWWQVKWNAPLVSIKLWFSGNTMV